MKKINFRYAFGEILIVIIGISIAFSINKYADNVKTSKDRNQYMSNLIEDVVADKKQLEENIKAIDTKIKNTTELLAVIDNPSIKNKPLTKVFQVATLISFTPKNITYLTLINSGDLNLIDNFNTRTAIEKHYSSYKILLKDYEREEIIHREYLGNYFIKNIDYTKIRKGENGFKDQKLLRNIVQSINGALMLKKQASSLAVKSCDNLLTILRE